MAAPFVQPGSGDLGDRIGHGSSGEGEAPELRWSDVDLIRSRLRIPGTLTPLSGRLLTTETKAASSRRWLPLCRDQPVLLETQRQAQEKDRGCAANIWVESGMVFTTASGEPMDPPNLLRGLPW